jgi:RNA polymerase sigma factor (sigma-70 family)
MMGHDHDNLSDAALVALVLEGAHEAFTTLLLRHHASVGRLCRQLLGSAIEAQDVAQEAALQAFLGLHRLEDPARFGAWLHAIAANLARMALRRRRVVSLDMLLDGVAPVVIWPQPQPSPEDIHAARELHDAIVAALGELSPAQREVAIGFFLEGYSYAELAELLGVPLSTIKGRLFKGRRQLQATLEPAAREFLRPDRRPRKEIMVSESASVEVKIDSIRKSLLTRHRVVVLQDTASAQYLPIWIGVPEAESIERALNGAQTERPMTHDLALRLLAPLGAQVTRVVINKLVNQTFFAEITLVLGGQEHIVDARPSDALALAARSGAPIYVTQTVLDVAREEVIGASVDTPPSPPIEPNEPSPLFAPTWEYLLSLASFQPGPPVEDLTEADWAARFPVQTTERDGQPLQAVRLPTEAPAWLLLPDPVWDEIDGTVRRWLANMQEVRSRRAVRQAETSSPEP